MRPIPAVLVAVLLFFVVSCRGMPDGRGSVGGGPVIAFEGGTIYRAPGEAPIRDGVLVVDGGRIVAVGVRGRVEVPAGAEVVDVTGRTVLAGFWNSHVHFMEPDWEGALAGPVDGIEALLRERYTRYGFVHLFDVGSFPAVTPELRRRIAVGEVAGPEIRTTGAPFTREDGTPVYLDPLRLPELLDVSGARDSVRERIHGGADGIKLFAVPIKRRQPFPVFPSEIVRAVAEEARAMRKPVFAHPTNLDGIIVAVENGVDVLTHTAPMAGPLADSILRMMLRSDVALIPTLTLFEDDYGRDTTGMGHYVRTAGEQASAYASLGGRLLFGTDVGYLSRYDPTREYELLAEAGLDFPAVLASLTTAPAEQFGAGDRTGRLAPGYDADIVVVGGDPVRDLRVLARPSLVMKRGQVLYRADGDRVAGADGR